MEDCKCEESHSFSKRENGVSLSRAVSLSRNSRQVVIKTHEFSDILLPETQRRINATLNVALAQAKAHHPNTCEILEVQLKLEGTKCVINHVLEALDTDTFEDMKKRKACYSAYSETDMCVYPLT